LGQRVFAGCRAAAAAAVAVVKRTVVHG